jgi:hypothetical protein
MLKSVTHNARRVLTNVAFFVNETEQARRRASVAQCAAMVRKADA